MQTKVNEFFNTHPDAAEVHAALGVLFTDKEKAASYLGGVVGKEVETYTRQTPVESGGQSTKTPLTEDTTGTGDGTTAGDVDETGAASQAPPPEPLTPEELSTANKQMLVGQTPTGKVGKPAVKTAAPKAVKPVVKGNGK